MSSTRIRRNSVRLSGPNANSEKIKLEVEMRQAAYAQCWESRNLVALCELYTAGCSVMPPDSTICYGKPGINRTANQLIDKGCQLLTLVSDDIEPVGSGMVIDRGGYKFLSRDMQIVETGKYVIVWKRVDGQLKIHMHIWNRSQ